MISESCRFRTIGMLKSQDRRLVYENACRLWQRLLESRVSPSDEFELADCGGDQVHPLVVGVSIRREEEETGLPGVIDRAIADEHLAVFTKDPHPPAQARARRAGERLRFAKAGAAVKFLHEKDGLHVSEIDLLEGRAGDEREVKDRSAGREPRDRAAEEIPVSQMHDDLFH